MIEKILYILVFCIAYPLYWLGMALMFIAALITESFCAMMDKLNEK